MDRKGFTLIELIVVLAILAILAAIALPNYMAIKCRACEAEAKEVLGEIRKLAWGYYIENNVWPTVATLSSGWGFIQPTGANAAYTYGGGNPYTAVPHGGGCLVNCSNPKTWTISLDTAGGATLT
jgi:prepilin-type N-terminal cleavage/methylation domain-containing protein